MRTPHGEFRGYHTSDDGLERISPASLAESVRVCRRVVEVLETNRTYVNLSPYGEPQLGRRGLYRTSGGAVQSPTDERALLWVLNLSDSRASLIDVAAQSGLDYAVIQSAAEQLQQAKLLAVVGSAAGKGATPDLAPR
jgi:aminopeptidase-like protein